MTRYRLKTDHSVECEVEEHPNPVWPNRPWLKVSLKDEHLHGFEFNIPKFVFEKAWEPTPDPLDRRKIDLFVEAYSVAKDGELVEIPEGMTAAEVQEALTIIKRDEARMSAVSLLEQRLLKLTNENAALQVERNRLQREVDQMRKISDAVATGVKFRGRGVYLTSTNDPKSDTKDADLFTRRIHEGLFAFL